MFKYMVI